MTYNTTAADQSLVLGKCLEDILKNHALNLQYFNQSVEMLKFGVKYQVLWWYYLAVIKHCINYTS